MSVLVFRETDAAQLRASLLFAPCVLCGLSYMFTVSLTSDLKHRGQQAEDILEQSLKNIS